MTFTGDKYVSVCRSVGSGTALQLHLSFRTNALEEGAVLQSSFWLIMLRFRVAARGVLAL